MDSTPRYELRDPPSDGITAIEFGKNNNQYLSVASWDKTLRLYDIMSNTLKTKIDLNTPVLDVSLENPLKGYCSGLDGSVKWVDFMTGAVNSLGNHQSGAKCVNYSFEINAVFSGSWDKTFGVWDSRAKFTSCSYILPHKVFAMDVLSNKLAIAMGDRNINIYDVRNLNQPIEKKQSNLRTMIRCIKIMPTIDGYIHGSVEGRVAVDPFDTASRKSFEKYAFKCHRQPYKGIDHVFPVNSIEFHPLGTFVTGGGDGTICSWNAETKKRLKQFPFFPTSISSISFTSDGENMAVASSYTFEEGEKDHPPDSIYIQAVSSIDFVPKKTSVPNSADSRTPY